MEAEVCKEAAKVTGKYTFSKENFKAIAKALKKMKKGKVAATEKKSLDETSANLEKFIGQAVAVVVEAAGKDKYGQVGDVKEVIKDKDEWKLRIFTPSGYFQVKPEFVQRMEKKGKVAQKSGKDLTRQLRQQWLGDLGRDCTLEEELEKEFPPVEAEMCSEHMQLYLKFLQWCYNSPVAILEIELLLLIFELQSSPDEEEAVKVYIKVARKKWETAEELLVPICQSGHWTLLVLRKEMAADQCQLRYYDSLSTESEPCRHLGQFLLDLLEIKAEVPARRNSSRQEKGSQSCGYWVVWYSEEEMRNAVGLHFGSRGWPSADQLQDLRKKFVKLQEGMKTELEKCKKDVKLNKEKALKAAAKAASKKCAAAKSAAALADAASAAAPEALEKTSPAPKKVHFEDLSEESREQVLKVKEKGWGTCGKCRWSAGGCLACNWEKTLEYWLKVENCNHEKSSSSSSAKPKVIKGGGVVGGEACAGPNKLTA